MKERLHLTDIERRLLATSVEEPEKDEFAPLRSPTRHEVYEEFYAKVEAFERLIERMIRNMDYPSARSSNFHIESSTGDEERVIQGIESALDSIKARPNFPDFGIIYFVGSNQFSIKSYTIGPSRL